jgi:hypothetical protein
MNMIIEDNIPMPDSVRINLFPKQKLKVLLNEMAVEQSVFVSFDDIVETHIRGIVANFAKKCNYNKRFVAKKTSDNKGLRIWRFQ